MENEKPASSLTPGTRTYILAWLGSIEVDMPHLLQVTRLALEIFDGMGSLHEEGTSGRQLLEAAALVHDVGLSVDIKSHHKHSSDMIRKQKIPGFSKQEIQAIACIARYHRKAVPSTTHAPFAALEPALRQTVERLSAILRVADGLDRSHLSRVRVVRCEVTLTEGILHLRAAGDIGTDLYGFEKKKGYFETLFGRKIRLAFPETA